MVKKHAPLYCTVQKVQYKINRLRGSVTYNIPHHQANHHCWNCTGLRARDFPWESARKGKILPRVGASLCCWLNLKILPISIHCAPTISFPGCDNLSHLACLQFSLSCCPGDFYPSSFLMQISCLPAGPRTPGFSSSSLPQSPSSPHVPQKKVLDLHLMVSWRPSNQMLPKGDYI